MVGDVLDLVGDRAAVDLAKPRQRIARASPRARRGEGAGGDPLLELRGQRRLERSRSSAGSPDRLGAERIEVRVQVPVHAVRLHERHRGGDGSDQLAVSRCRSSRWSRRLGGDRRRLRLGRRDRDRSHAVPVVALPERDEPLEPGQRSDERVVGALEELAPLRVDGLGVVEIPLELLPRYPAFKPDDCTFIGLVSAGLVEGAVGEDGHDHAEHERQPPKATANAASVPCRVVIRVATRPTMIALVASSTGLRAMATADRASEKAQRNPATRSERRSPRESSRDGRPTHVAAR